MRNARRTHLRQFALGTLALVLGRSQGSDVHLLCLLTHVLLVSRDSLNDEEVTVDDEEQWREVNEQTVHDDVRSGEQVLVQVIGTASSHVALGHVAARDKNCCIADSV